MLAASAMAECDLQPLVQTVPGTMVSFRMIPIPDGSIELGGSSRFIENLAVAELETTWDLFDIWAFGYDLSAEEIAGGFDAVCRPSRPYGSPDRGFGHAGYPAIGITFHAAESFCAWLSAKCEKKYRLPTEAEWEYAARAGAPLPDDWDAFAWHWGNSEDSTRPAGSKAPNAWGLFDMAGNAGEWAIDLAGTPVVCGGSFRSKAHELGPCARLYQRPRWNERDPQTPKSQWWLPDGEFVGFRIVQDL